MNRIFHARIAPGHCLFLLLMTFLAVWGLWEKRAVVALFAMLLLVFVIERLIHTTYTVTPQGTLQLYYGRFARRHTIPLSDITGVERMSSLRIGGFALMHSVVVHYGAGRCVALLPVKEAEFMQLLRQRAGLTET